MASDRCPRCGALVLPQERFCAQCGAPLAGDGGQTQAAQVQVAEAQADRAQAAEAPAAFTPHPATIDELKTYCRVNGMPLEKMRFFVGEDYRQPRAFGIYRDGDEFIVYKNKADGSRAVRYHGPDEAYAVNELFLKLLDECHARGIYPDGKPQMTESRRKSQRQMVRMVFVVALVAILLTAGAIFLSAHEHRHDGYYRYADDAYYYRYGDSWFYDDLYYDDWVEVDDFPYDGYEGYYLGDDYDSSWAADDFRESSAWDDIQEESHTSSSDYSGWDSGGTDWSSDW